MVAAAERELGAAGVAAAPEVVLADAGYWHHEQMDEIAARGTTVLVPPDAGKRKGARPGWEGGRYDFMRRMLETDAGRDLYSKRQGMIEPIFANTKFNRRIDRFLRRGRAACRFRMAPHHRHPQPPQAPHRYPGRLSGNARARSRLRSSTRSSTQPLNGLLLTGCSTGTAQPSRTPPLYATATRGSSSGSIAAGSRTGGG
jgi:hypothetical protein